MCLSSATRRYFVSFEPFSLSLMPWTVQVPRSRKTSFAFTIVCTKETDQQIPSYFSVMILHLRFEKTWYAPLCYWSISQIGHPAFRNFSRPIQNWEIHFFLISNKVWAIIGSIDIIDDVWKSWFDGMLSSNTFTSRRIRSRSLLRGHRGRHGKHQREHGVLRKADGSESK